MIARNVTPSEKIYDGSSIEFARAYPLYNEDLETLNLTCGREAWKSAAKTETATVIAGTQLGFQVERYRETNFSKIYDGVIFHEGPAHMYMAKAKDDVALEDWLGDDGDWFKVKEWRAINRTAWEATGKASVSLHFSYLTQTATIKGTKLK
jgi:hypothetical protein